MNNETSKTSTPAAASPLTAKPDLVKNRRNGLTMNIRPKQPKYARNKNVVVIGGSGAEKQAVKPRCSFFLVTY